MTGIFARIRSSLPRYDARMDRHRLRGDYSNVAADCTVVQDWSAYGPAEHAIWRHLYHRQRALLPRYAAHAFVAALDGLDAADGIPRFDRVSSLLQRITGWRLVAVPGLIPDDMFFAHLAARRFPVTIWIRRPEELDYLVEPDVFHDFFGHVPMLVNPVFADFLAAYGAMGPEAIRCGGLQQLARLYWYMVEFGLLATAQGIRAYGAGILSSRTETVYATTDPRPNRIGFDVGRVMLTDYRIDRLQQTYFVLERFEDLFAAAAIDLAPLYSASRDAPALSAATVLAGDRVYSRGLEAAA